MVNAQCCGSSRSIGHGLPAASSAAIRYKCLDALHVFSGKLRALFTRRRTFRNRAASCGCSVSMLMSSRISTSRVHAALRLPFSLVRS
jgi:hypothetical protein